MDRYNIGDLMALHAEWHAAMTLREREGATRAAALAAGSDDAAAYGLRDWYAAWAEHYNGASAYQPD